VKTMKDVIKATTPTTPKTIKWGLDLDAGDRWVCSNILFHVHRAANRKANRR